MRWGRCCSCVVWISIGLGVFTLVAGYFIAYHKHHEEDLMYIDEVTKNIMQSGLVTLAMIGNTDLLFANGGDDIPPGIFHKVISDIGVVEANHLRSIIQFGLTEEPLVSNVGTYKDYVVERLSVFGSSISYHEEWASQRLKDLADGTGVDYINVEASEIDSACPEFRCISWRKYPFGPGNSIDVIFINGVSIIAHRGTNVGAISELLKALHIWTTDDGFHSGWAISDHPEELETLAKVKAWVERANAVILTGHSKGGARAQNHLKLLLEDKTLNGTWNRRWELVTYAVPNWVSKCENGLPWAQGAKIRTRSTGHNDIVVYLFNHVFGFKCQLLIEEDIRLPYPKHETYWDSITWFVIRSHFLDEIVQSVLPDVNIAYKKFHYDLSNGVFVFVNTVMAIMIFIPVFSQVLKRLSNTP